MAPKVGLTFRFDKKAEPYRLALRDAGLEIVDLTPDTPAADLAGVSGLVLSGGSDISPTHYLLAICRGMQLLNVLLGGTLHQDIGEAHTLVTHPVEIVPGTRLHTILGPGVEANSRHHQAVDQLAPGLLRTATAPDGTTEGIERPGDAFVVGVQWHPEDLPDRRLFDAFREAVRIWKQ